MDAIIETDQKTIAIELANAIAPFDINKVADLLKEDGEYSIQDEKDEIGFANKANFLKWLSSCIDEFLFVNEDRSQLNYDIDKCSYCRIGNPVLIFENGRFPVFTRKLWEREKCGLMLEFKDNLVSDISFCWLFLTTENPYLFEMKCIKHLD
jgi:hypothetical protein